MKLVTPFVVRGQHYKDRKYTYAVQKQNCGKLQGKQKEIKGTLDEPSLNEKKKNGDIKIFAIRYRFIKREKL